MAKNLTAPIQPFHLPKVLASKNSIKLPISRVRLWFRWRRRSRDIKCCNINRERESTRKDYYGLLGVAVDASPPQIKEAYRKLQKQYHPDIAGQKGHEFTLLLNEAYRVLMRDDLRRRYDASTGKGLAGTDASFSGFASSSWNGPLRPHALFVDENSCIGCRECVHHAGKTFMMDEALGCARVKNQFGDDDKKIEVSVESCPVNCIHWVEREDLPVLEFLIKPQPKPGYGVFGGGWERPADVFMAAEAFKKLCNQNHQKQYEKNNEEEESPAQVKARKDAGLKLQMEKLLNIWFWIKGLTNFS
ncbi:chaperone protein dnaJ C76, chloroplastic-like isoform X1 [Nymphaea colorata]|nr:chaperone protein dnaJ C76, chloroplastic-like isoform X1 [Nymphaea colorata]